MASQFRIEVAREQDLPEVVRILIPSFQHVPLEPMMGNVPTAEGFKAAEERHIRAWKEHAEESSIPCAIKCVHTDPSTGKETIVGFAEWFIFDRPRSKENFTKDNYLMSASWLPQGGPQEKVKSILKPMMDARIKWMGQNPFGLFMYMAVDKAWRRRGVSTLCVQWGIDKCNELGIPAYLEATEEGEHVYKRLGFVEVDKVEVDMDGVKGAFPAMIWWPPATKEEDKKPAIQ